MPNSLAAFSAGARKLAKMNPKNSCSPVYLAGTDWYVGMGFVYDYGGSIATTSHGKWVGQLGTARSRTGLLAYKNFFATASHGSATASEANPQPYNVYGQGQAASIVGPAWFSCCVGKKYTAQTKQFVMPSHTKGLSMPGFLGGSDLAVPSHSSNQALAKDWIRIFTGTQGEKGLQSKGNIPNATNLLGTSVNERAAARSWFVPTSKNWVNVENGNILRTMLSQILTGRSTIKAATAWADDNIALTLNQS